MPTRYGWMDDTSPKALEALIELSRRLTPGERLERMFELNEMMEKLAEEDVRCRYPNAGEREVFLRKAARRLGRDLMIKAYGWDPEAHGE